MKKTVKLLALVISIVLLVSLFAACNKDNTDKETNATSATTASVTQETTAEQGPVKLSIAVNPGSNPLPNDGKYLVKMGEHFGIEFDVWPCYGEEYPQQVNLRLATGDRPDILYAQDIPLIDLIDQDIITEIPVDMLKENMPIYWEEQHKVFDQPFIYTTIDNKIYGLTGSYAEGDYPYVPVIRDDWLANVGITDKPETIEQLETVLYAFANNDPDQNGKKDTYGLSDRALQFVFGAFGGVPYDQDDEYETFSVVDGQVKHTAALPEMKDALKLLNKWYNDGVLDPEFITGEHTDGHWSFSQAFFKGRIGFSTSTMFYYLDTAEVMGRSTDGRFYVAFHESQSQLGNEGASYTWTKQPTGPNGKSGAVKWGALGGDSATTFGKHLANEPEKMKKAMQWLDTIWGTIDGYGMVSYGEKNVDWFYNEAEKEIVAFASPETKAAFDSDTLQSLGLTYGFEQSLIGMSKKMYGRQFEYADMVDGSTKNYLDVLGGAPIESMANYSSDVYQITLQAYFEMITGKKDIDTYFDEYVNMWNEAGGAEIMEEGTAWYNNVVAK